LEEGLPVNQVLEEGLLSGMTVIGVKFKNNEIFVPEVLVVARVMNHCMEVLKPKTRKAGMANWLHAFPA
jgi:methanogenic corrinoid protein MtbC1